MASPAQITANRANSQRSTGPRTEVGKQASRGNAMRHGLTGAQIVIPGENPDHYEELRQGMHDSHRPANEPERVLVDQIAANAWRLLRAQRIETAVLAKFAEGADDPDAAIALAFLERPKDLDRIMRYVTAASRAYYQSLNQLLKLQKERETRDRDAAMMNAELVEVAMSATPPIGFVSKNATAAVPATLPLPGGYSSNIRRDTDSL